MALISRVGVVVPADSEDPVADVRRLESLGFGHAALLGVSPARTLLALGGTRALVLLTDDPTLTSGAVAGLGGLCASYRERLRPWVAANEILKLSPEELDEPQRALASIEAQLARPGTSEPVVTLEFPHGDQARLVHTLALDILTDGLPGRAGPLLYADDLAVGDTFELGEVTVTEDDVIAFGERWDPLDFHIDPELARSSPLGVLCASGMQTQAILQRLGAKGLHRNLAIVAGRGMLGMRLWAPVVPGMTLRGRTEILEVKLRATSRAVVTVRATLADADRLILEQTGEMVVQQRDRSPAGAHR